MIGRLIRFVKTRFPRFYRLYRFKKLFSPPMGREKLRYKIWVGEPEWIALTINVRVYRKKAGTRLLLNILNARGSHILRQAVAHIDEVDDQGFVDFSFPAIACGPGGKEFVVEFALQDPSLQSTVCIREEWAGTKSKVLRALETMGVRHILHQWQTRFNMCPVRRGLLYFVYDPHHRKYTNQIFLQRFMQNHYQERLASERFTGQDLKTLLERNEKFATRPRFSIIIPIYNITGGHLKSCIESIKGQAYPDWELLLIDIGSDQPNIVGDLHSYRDDDPRITLIQLKEVLEISKASETGLAHATGDYAIFLSRIGNFSPDALFEFADALQTQPDIDFIYSDEDEIDYLGRRMNPNFKPGWSPEFLRSNHYTSQLSAYRTDLVKTVNAFGLETDGGWEFDLALRIADATDKVLHIPKVLFHGNVLPIVGMLANQGAIKFHIDSQLGSFETSNSNYELYRGMEAQWEARYHEYQLKGQKKALEKYLERNKLSGKVHEGPVPGTWRVAYDPPAHEPLVSIVMPCAGKDMPIRGVVKNLLIHVLESIYEKTTYKNFEVVVVYNGTLPQKAVDYCATKPNVRLLFHPQPYNDFSFSVAVNKGAEAGKGEYVLLMNDDMEVIEPEWLSSMVGLAQLKGVGSVGAKLLFENDSFQHIGIASLDAGPNHVSHALPEENGGPGNINHLTHNRLAVTAACKLVRRDLYLEMGGYDLDLAMNFNDVDFCIRLLKKGYRNVINPHASLYHLESVSKVGTSIKELEIFMARWAGFKDIYYNPNFEPEIPTHFLRTDDTRWVEQPKYYPKWMTHRISVRRILYLPPSEEKLFSILTPVYNPPFLFLKDLAKTVLKQSYKNFEWVIIDNGSNEETLEQLKKIAEDPRVRLTLNKENRGIVDATRQALEQATGDYVFTVDHDDLLYLDSLAVVATYLKKHPDADLIYSDEDKFNETFLVTEPYFKPDWDPALLNACCYTAHLSGVRRELALECGAYTDKAVEGAQDWDMFMRASRQPGTKVLHIPEMLYSWRVHQESVASKGSAAKPYVVDAQRHLLTRHLEEKGQAEKFEVEPNPLIPVFWRLKRKPVDPPPLQVVLCAGEDSGNFQSCLESVLGHTDYPDWTLHIVGDINDEKQSIIERIGQAPVGKGCKIQAQKSEPIEALKSLVEPLASSKNPIVWITDDVEITSPEWAWEAVGLLEYYEDASWVGGKIVDRSWEIVYGSGYFGFNGHLGSPESGCLINELGYFSNNVLQKSVDAVSPLFWTAEAEFLHAVLSNPDLKTDPYQLAWDMALAIGRLNRRVLCTPFIHARLICEEYAVRATPGGSVLPTLEVIEESLNGRPRYYHPHFFHDLKFPYIPKWEP